MSDVEVYRVVRRVKDSENEFVATGVKLYQHIGSARGVKTRNQNESDHYATYYPNYTHYEYAVQGIVINDAEWEIV